MRKKFTVSKWAVVAALLAGLAAGVGGAGPLDEQDNTGRTREDGGRREGGSRESPDQPADVDALVKMLQVPSGPVRVGDRVTLEVTISSRQDVGHAPFHVRFDPAVLRFESGEEGPFLSADGKQTAFFSNATTSGDAVVVGLSRLGRGQGAEGSGGLCTLHFVAVGAGDAGLGFARASVRDGYNRILQSRFEPVRLNVQ